MHVPALKVAILTIFPEAFPGILNYSISGSAIKEKKCIIDIYDIKNFGIGKHNKVDDKIYGGGSGMLMRSDVLDKAISYAKSNYINPKIVYTSPKGKPYNQDKARELLDCKELIILCGRFEGIDQRVIEHHEIEEISIGDYILSNGEIAAFVIIDSCIRLIPEVISSSSLIEESFSENSKYKYLLEYPQYTKPVVWKNYFVPDVLLSGNHLVIEKWRLLEAEKLTKLKRKDLWKKYLKNE